VAVAKAFNDSGEDLKYMSATLGVDSKVNVGIVQDTVMGKGSYGTNSMDDLRKELLTAVNTVQWGLVGFGALALLASVFGIVNTMYISVLERTSQIGLMKALGASRRDIGRLFRNEAAWVGFLGAMIGVGLSFLLTLCNPMITTALHLDKGTNLLVINPLYTALLVVGLVLLAVRSARKSRSGSRCCRSGLLRSRGHASRSSGAQCAISGRCGAPGTDRQGRGR
jgi:putative ABC transport system permease protein